MLRWVAGFMAVFCLLAVVRVEWLDHQAGGAIHRKLEQEPDSKWTSHVSNAEPTPRDRTGDALKTWGVALHVVAVALVFFSLFRQARDGIWRSGWAGLAVIGMGLLGWAFYRQYFVALGW